MCPPPPHPSPRPVFASCRNGFNYVNSAACPGKVVLTVPVGNSGYFWGTTSPTNVANVNARVSFGGPGGPKFDLVSLRPSAAWQDGLVLQVGRRLVVRLRHLCTRSCCCCG